LWNSSDRVRIKPAWREAYIRDLVLAGDDDVLGFIVSAGVRSDERIALDARVAVGREQTVVLLHAERLAALARSGTVDRQQTPSATRANHTHTHTHTHAHPFNGPFPGLPG